MIELLVVIAIIAVLAAAGFAAGRAAMEKAKKVTAQSAATSLASAVEQFYSEYSTLPDPTGTGTADAAFTTEGTNGVRLLEILSGKEAGTDPQNFRKINFLSVKDAKGNAANYRDGIFYSGNTIVGLHDPWFRPYTVTLNLDYNETLTVSPGNPIPNQTLNGKNVAVFSLGVPAGNNASTKTLVKTW
ncbi:MAG: hypothetical protein H7Y36_00325 [Armatimonadetes bacterium]|nr:hypothetical protein [Akkermansiaceae bacterium]